jgi:hypothetical protein
MALAAAAVCAVPRAGRAEWVDALDYATVGRVVARLVDGRTVVVIPVAGTLRPRLSEPIRAGKRWRLDLVIEDAKLSISAPVKRPAGVASLTVEEVGSDVKVSIEVVELGDYGARRSEEGMLLWIDAVRKEPVVAAAPSGLPTSIPITSAAAQPQQVRSSRAQDAPVAPESTGWTGLIALAIGAAGAGAAVRHVRRNGWPAWADDLRANAVPRLRALFVGGGSAAEEPDVTEAQPDEAPRVPFGRSPSDPRGRSAEIGDAFRVQPEKPASGIAALVATNENDAE